MFFAACGRQTPAEGFFDTQKREYLLLLSFLDMTPNKAKGQIVQGYTKIPPDPLQIKKRRYNKINQFNYALFFRAGCKSLPAV